MLDLISELPQSLPYQTTFDNFFTSAKLLDHLRARGLGAVSELSQLVARLDGVEKNVSESAKNRQSLQQHYGWC